MKRKRPVAEAREAESPLIKQRVADPDGVVSRGASNASLTRRDMAKSAGKKTGQRDAADGVEKGGASISGGNGENHVGKNEGDKISGDRIKKQKRGGVRSVRPDGTEIVSGNDMSKGEKRQRENGNTHGADQRAANGGSKRRERQYIDEDKGKRKRKKGTEGDGADTSGKHGEAEEREMGVSSERAKVQVESERNAVTEQDVSNEGKSKRRKEKKKERGVILGGASDVKEISEADAHGSETTGKRKQGAGVCAGVRAADDKGEMLANGGGDKASLRPAPRQSALLDKMRARLQGGHFRMLNERLYTTRGADAFASFQKDPGQFQHYHRGYQEQMAHWPKLPVQVVGEWLRAHGPALTVADFGCGDARLAASVKNRVFSLDLVAAHPGVIACNMAHAPLESASVDVAVFCLSLMGTDYGSFLEEAHRVLVSGGWLLIAEVKSRFDPRNGGADPRAFAGALKKLGFQSVRQDDSNKMFIWWEFRKGGEERPGKKGGGVTWPALKACIYKRR